MEIKPENKQANPQQERCDSPEDLLSSLCLGPNQLVWAGSYHCTTGVTLREGRFVAKHLFLWRNQDFSSVNGVFHPWADNTAHGQASTLLSLPCPYFYYHRPSAQNAAGKECQLWQATVTRLWGWEKRDKDRKKDMHTSLEHISVRDNGWLSPFQLPGQIASQKTHHCTFTFLLSFSAAFHYSYKTRKNTPLQRIPPWNQHQLHQCKSLLYPAKNWSL